MDNSHEIIEGNAYTMAIRHIKLERRVPQQKVNRGTLEMANWNHRLVACWNEGDPPAGQSRRYLNSASMSVLSRRLMAIEWKRALGRTIPDSYAVTPRRRSGITEDKRILSKNV